MDDKVWTSIPGGMVLSYPFTIKTDSNGSWTSWGKVNVFYCTLKCELTGASIIWGSNTATYEGSERDRIYTLAVFIPTDGGTMELYATQQELEDAIQEYGMPNATLSDAENAEIVLGLFMDLCAYGSFAGNGDLFESAFGFED